jgi:hypothetical protein
MNLSGQICITVAKGTVAAGQAATKSDILDMAGYDGVLFIASMSDNTSGSVATLAVQQNSANSTTGMATITGASASNTSTAGDAQNDKLLMVDVYRPLQRYIQGLFTSGTQDIAKGPMIAIRYCGSKAPIADDATILDSAVVVGS